MTAVPVIKREMDTDARSPIMRSPIGSSKKGSQKFKKDRNQDVGNDLEVIDTNNGTNKNDSEIGSNGYVSSNEDERESRARRGILKQREKQDSSEEDKSSGRGSNDEEEAQEKALNFINTIGDKEDTEEKLTQPTATTPPNDDGQAKNLKMQQQESIETRGAGENLLDIISFHSKLSKSPMEVASLQKSVKSSAALSHKDKQQIQDVIKKVNFFSLKQQNNDSDDSQGMEEGDEYDIDGMNRSIQKNKGGLKRNPKSFNFTM